MITEFGSLCQRNEAADDTIESWKMDNVAGSLLASICEMGISSLEIRCYGYGVYAKYMERAAWAEIRRRLQVYEAATALLLPSVDHGDIRRPDTEKYRFEPCLECGGVDRFRINKRNGIGICTKCGYTTETEEE